MGSVEAASGEGGDRPLSNPWPLLGTGLTATVLACLWMLAFKDAATPFRLVLLGVGLLATGAAVAIRPMSAAVLGLAALSGLLASQSMSEWDSARLMTRFLSVVAAVSAVLVLMPRPVCRLVVSLAIVFHFGGILTAVTSVSPQPWLSGQLWARVYRPYLEFMYLNNAYHFYSPDPGPATLIWFRIEYEDKSARWVKIPNRHDYDLTINYQRRLSLTESINVLQAPAAGFPPQLLFNRKQAGAELRIPMHPEVPEVLQYREPQTFSKRMLETYARHAAWTYKHLHDPEKKATGVKIYRVVHNLPVPGQIIARKGQQEQLDDETAYTAYFQGEFDPDGNLKNPHDPFLYWLIPILRVPKDSSVFEGLGSPGFRIDMDKLELRDYVSIHAGDKKAD